MGIRTGIVSRSGRRAAGLVALALLGLVAASGCGRRERTVMPVTIDERIGSAAPRHPQDFSSHESVVRGVATILRRDLGLPVPEHVTVYLYSSRALFERGLVDDGRLAPVRAAELGEFAVGRRQTPAAAATQRGRPPGVARLAAAHRSRADPRGADRAGQSEGQAEQWLTEGMAEWAAFSVLERLGLETLAERRAVAHGEIRDYPALHAGPAGSGDARQPARLHHAPCSATARWRRISSRS